MTRYLRTEAIVLKKKHLLNKDKFVTLFSEKFGKLFLIAKGVKKITSRRLPHLETGNLIKVNIYKRKDYLYLNNTSLISGFYQIKRNQKKYQFIYKGLNIIDKLLPENQPENKVYKLTIKFLVNLSKDKICSKDLQLFYDDVFYFLGYGRKKRDQFMVENNLKLLI